MDWVRNEELYRTGVVRELAGWAEQDVLVWFGHVESIDDNWFMKKINTSDVRGLRLRGKPQMEWMDSMKRVLDARWMSVAEIN